MNIICFIFLKLRKPFIICFIFLKLRKLLFLQHLALNNISCIFDPFALMVAWEDLP